MTFVPLGTVAAKIAADLEQRRKSGNYCFACDRVVTKPCEREDCLEAISRRPEAERCSNSQT
jgi:hypothetical protein